MKRILTFLIISVMLITFSCQKQNDKQAPPETSSQKNPHSQDFYAAKIAKAKAAAEAKLATFDKVSEKLLAEHQALVGTLKASAKKMLIKVPKDYATIQEAVDNAADGATINVSGSYTENVVIEGLSNININGGGSATLAPTTSSDFPLFIHNSTGISIKGFNIVDGPLYIGRSHQIEIKNNDLSGLGDGIDLVRSDNSSIKNNVVHDKISGSNGSGDAIFLYLSNQNMITNNHTSGNADHGINLTASSENTIQSNISTRDNNGGIHLYNYFDAGSETSYGSNSNTIQNNEVSGSNWLGFFILESDQNVLKGNQSHNNFVGIQVVGTTGTRINDCICNYNSLDGIDLFADSDNLLTGSTANNNGSYGIFVSGDNDATKNCTALNNVSCDYGYYGDNITSSNNVFGNQNCD